MPLRYMGSVTGPDSKHWASEICTVPVIGFQAYSDNNNGKKLWPQNACKILEDAWITI